MFDCKISLIDFFPEGCAIGALEVLGGNGAGGRVDIGCSIGALEVRGGNGADIPVSVRVAGLSIPDLPSMALILASTSCSVFALLVAALTNIPVYCSTGIPAASASAV